MDFPDNPTLEVEVQDYFGSDKPPWLCCWVVMSQIGGDVELHQEESARYALSRLLPATDLVRWVEDIITYQDTRRIGFQQAVDSFIMQYSKSDRTLPLVWPLVGFPELAACLANIYVCIFSMGSSEKSINSTV